MSDEAPKPAQDPESGRFLAGNSGNGGRPKGARAKLGEAFLRALSADWDAHGVEAIEAVRSEDPSTYVKVVASLLPKELTLGEDGDGIPSGFTVTFIRPAAPTDGDD